METIKIKGIDEEIYFTTSKKGLPIYIWKNDYAKSFYMSLNVKYGSIHTEFMINNKKYRVPQGIAHFMEHIKFNVDKDTTANDLFDKLGSDINAFTTFKFTSYLVMGVNSFEENLNNLLDYVYNPYFTKEIIKKEKGIIESEINMGKDQPFNRLYFEFNNCLYHKDKYKYLITGESYDIKKIELKDIMLIYEAFYHPKNMFLIVAGNVNPYEVEKIVNANLDTKEIGEYLNPKIIKTKESKSVAKKECFIKANVEVAKAKVGLKLDRQKFKNFDKVKLGIILSILINCNFGDTSDFKEKLLQEELITYMHASRTITDNFVIIDITIESKYIDEAIKRVVNALNNLSVDKQDFKRKLNSSIATLILNYENSESVNNLIQNYLINYDSILPDLKEIYESIEYSDIIEVLNKINTDEMVILKMAKND